MSHIRDSLSQLAMEIGTMTPAINAGGCCVFAGIVSEALRWHNVEHSLKVHSLLAEDVPDALEFALNNVMNANDYLEWADNGVRFGHVLVDIKGYGLYDGGGFVHDRFCLYEGSISSYHALELARCKAGWNETFPRRMIPSIINAVECSLHVPMLTYVRDLEWEY